MSYALLLSPLAISENQVQKSWPGITQLGRIRVKIKTEVYLKLKTKALNGFPAKGVQGHIKCVFKSQPHPPTGCVAFGGFLWELPGSIRLDWGFPSCRGT